LPFASSSFDMVVAGFVVNHLDAPHTALREMARVVRRGGVVLASAFETGPSHVTKEQVDRALASFGFENPAWHDALKTEREPRTGTVDGLRRVAAAGGFASGDVDVVSGAVDSGLRTAADFVDYRFGMASHAPFVASLDAATRARAYDAALAAIGDDPPPLVPTLLVLVARRP
jgi:SAM-dependent methyltransferase